MKTLDIACAGYSVTADVYEGDADKPIVMHLIGRTSRRDKKHYRELCPRLLKELGATSVVFDYSGHGDSPFDISTTTPAQHTAEVVHVYDWIKDHYPGRKLFVVGSSYGGFLCTQLALYRSIDGIVFRAPAIYPPRDFYTPIVQLTHKYTAPFRNDKSAVSAHPMFEAANYVNDVLLMTHELDQVIPRTVTDAYREAFNAEEIVVRGMNHSLDGATKEFRDDYNSTIFDWLCNHFI